MAHDKETNRLDELLSTVSLSGLLAGVRDYLRTWGQVMRDRHRFAAIHLTPQAETKFRSAVTAYLVGVFLSFVIFLVVLRLNHLQVTKLDFLFQCLYLQILYTLLIHLAAWLARGSGTLRDTATVSLYFFSVYVPFAMLLMAPLVLDLQLINLVDPEYGTIPAQTYERFSYSSPWLIYLMILSVTAAFLCCALWLPWLCSAHSIKLRWLVLAIIGVYWPAMLLHQYFVAPYAAHALHLASDFIEALL
ncbi:MAG: hypothetical protein L0Z53_25590 [Acidobacteriales bacterium]|nr:hypothetical protein [Terriglobales bacterium]